MSIVRQFAIPAALVGTTVLTGCSTQKPTRGVLPPESGLISVDTNGSEPGGQALFYMPDDNVLRAAYELMGGKDRNGQEITYDEFKVDFAQSEAGEGAEILGGIWQAANLNGSFDSSDETFRILVEGVVGIYKQAGGSQTQFSIGGQEWDTSNVEPPFEIDASEVTPEKVEDTDVVDTEQSVNKDEVEPAPVPEI